MYFTEVYVKYLSINTPVILFKTHHRVLFPEASVLSFSLFIKCDRRPKLQWGTNNKLFQKAFLKKQGSMRKSFLWQAVFIWVCLSLDFPQTSSTVVYGSLHIARRLAEFGLTATTHHPKDTFSKDKPSVVFSATEFLLDNSISLEARSSPRAGSADKPVVQFLCSISVCLGDPAPGSQPPKSLRSSLVPTPLLGWVGLRPAIHKSPDTPPPRQFRTLLMSQRCYQHPATIICHPHRALSSVVKVVLLYHASAWRQNFSCTRKHQIPIFIHYHCIFAISIIVSKRHNRRLRYSPNQVEKVFMSIQLNSYFLQKRRLTHCRQFHAFLLYHSLQTYNETSNIAFPR